MLASGKTGDDSTHGSLFLIGTLTPRLHRCQTSNPLGSLWRCLFTVPPSRI